MKNKHEVCENVELSPLITFSGMRSATDRSKKRLQQSPENMNESIELVHLAMYKKCWFVSRLYNAHKLNHIIKITYDE